MLGLASCEERGPGGGAGPEPLQGPDAAGRARMVEALAEAAVEDGRNNPFRGTGWQDSMDRAVEGAAASADGMARAVVLASRGKARVARGQFAEGTADLEEAYRFFEALPGSGPTLVQVSYALGVSHLRRSIYDNCLAAADPVPCVVPFGPGVVFPERAGCESAIDWLTHTVEVDGAPVRKIRQATWLMNIAAMALGEFPGRAPVGFQLPDKVFGERFPVPGFPEVAAEIGLAHDGFAGGLVVDDLDGDHDLDVMVSSSGLGDDIALFVNEGPGGFVDRTDHAGLRGITGGSTLVQADYDNDGDLDVFVARGAWLGKHGRHPNSLLRNEGGGVFSDVTFAAGLAEPALPTGSAAWGDYDNDGDVDIFVGNEHAASDFDPGAGFPSPGPCDAPCQLFRNDGDGTFTDVADEAGVTNQRFTKGAVWADLDGDRWPELVVANHAGENRVYKNFGDGTFGDRALASGITAPFESCALWVWDFDNDGAPDIFFAPLRGTTDTFAMHALKQGSEAPGEDSGPAAAAAAHYRGNGDGTFTDLTVPHSLAGPLPVLGGNFGDVNNDGFLDCYLGVGLPDLETLIPDQLFVSHRANGFKNVTADAGMGHLLTGGATAFADLDEDGDQDIVVRQGGFVPADRAALAVHANPAGVPHRWIKVKLVGTASNRAALGARLRFTFTDAGEERVVYRWVSAGGSGGASSLRQHVGIGGADRVDHLEVFWPATGSTQQFHSLDPGQTVVVTEGSDRVQRIRLPSGPYRPNL